MIDWITDEEPEETNAYLVTWKGRIWVDSFIGICTWDNDERRWVLEDFEPWKKYRNENIIITAWADIEPYKE